jgi:uroporphyrinogen-III decarboxylase
MTSRERLLRLFANQEIDHIPVWLLFPYHPYGSYTDVYKNPYYKSIIPYIDKYCDTFDRRKYPASEFCFNGNQDIIQEKLTENINGFSTEIRQIRCKKLVLQRYVETTASGKIIHNFIDNPEKLKDIAAIPYIFPEPDFKNIIKEQDELGNKGLLMMDLGDPLVPLYSLVSAEDFALWSLTDYDVILEFTDLMYQRCLARYKTCLENNIGDVFFIVGAEFAGPPLVSPKKFNELSARFVKGIVDLIRSYGKYSIVHYHGNLHKVLSGMKEINPDGLHTIEAPPIGDCTLTQARSALGNMVLIGNVQYDDLRSQDPAGIEILAKAAIDEARGGRFILSPTAGPYEEIITEHQIKNYIALIEGGMKYGKNS